MPFAPRIRKEILKALDESIIPALWQQQVPLGYAAPPLQFPQGIEKSLLNSRLPRRDGESLGLPVQASWAKAKLHSTSHPYLSFIYEGVATEHTLITAAHSAQFKISKGIYAIRYKAPGALYFPAEMPRNTGVIRFLNADAHLQASPIKIVHFAIRDKILVHTHNETAIKREVSHSLQIEDKSLLAMAHLFQEEIQYAPASHQAVAQAMLLTFMLRLRNYLSSRALHLANTSYPRTIEPHLPNKHAQDLCQKAIYFIQTHLHESLSVPLIAREVGLSPTHLNRLFRQFKDVSVMHYVRQQRIEAAKEILILDTISVNEIAGILNFKRPDAFCTVFRHETGMTPLQFRRQRQNKSTFTNRK